MLTGTVSILSGPEEPEQRRFFVSFGAGATCFNPLRPRRAGATSNSCLEAASVRVSILSPAPKSRSNPYVLVR